MFLNYLWMVANISRAIMSFSSKKLSYYAYTTTTKNPKNVKGRVQHKKRRKIQLA